LTIVLKRTLLKGSGVVLIDKGDFLLIVLAMDTPTSTAIDIVRALVSPEQLTAIQAKYRPWMAYPDLKAVAMANHDLIIEVAV